MEENEELLLEMDVSSAEDSLENIHDMFEGLQCLAVEIGKEMSKAFIPLQKNLQKVEARIDSMTSALNAATIALQTLIEHFSLNTITEKISEAIGSFFSLEGFLETTFEGVVSGVVTVVVEKLSKILAGLGKISPKIALIVTAVIIAVAAITAAIVAIVKNWDQISLAFTTFFTETLPRLWEQFVQWGSSIAAKAAEFAVVVSAAVADCWVKIQAVWDVVAEWFCSNVIEPVVTLFSFLWDGVCTLAVSAWEKLKPVLGLLGGGFEDTFGFIGEMAMGGAGVVCDALSGITSFLANVFAGNWDAAWQDLTATLKTVVNGVIGLLNTMLSRLASALNKVIGVANTLSFTVPVWVPGIGGKHFGVNMNYVTAPQIPYLAQGAVLPANKPFLAVVGDQRHGTNIEAPLATIQEAVGLVMNEQISAMMAGFQALLEEQRATRQAVESICVGDETIANAVSRHNHRLAMMRGY